MTFRITVRDGTRLIVDGADLDVITAYLVLRGYPPVIVEEIQPLSSDASVPGEPLSFRAGS